MEASCPSAAQCMHRHKKIRPLPLEWRKKRNEKIIRTNLCPHYSATYREHDKSAAERGFADKRRLPFRIPSEMQNEKRIRQVFRLTTAVFVPHPFPYAAEQRSATHTVVSGAAETAAGAAGQLAQTSLLNAPISPKHDRLHLGAYLHAPFSFTIIL